MRNSFGYDEFDRLTARTVTQGTVQNFTYGYDRYGNRWTQNAPQGGPSLSISFNQGNNIISTSGFANDVVGNVADDTFHIYSYDADGNLISVDNGATATYYYDSLNQRVRIAPTRGTYEFVWDVFGRRVSNWAASNHSFVESNAYTDSSPIAIRSGGQTEFEHQNWLGTERVRTTYNGGVAISIASLPWADGHTPSGDNGDQHDFALMNRDLEDNSEHAQYRQFSTNVGRFLSPDPGWFFASRLENPQTWNLYSYAVNNPLTNTDPDGYDCVYLNDAGTGIDKDGVDTNSNSGECGNNGGYWVDGTATKVTLFTNSNDVGLSGQIGGNQLGQGQSTDAFYSSVNATEQSSLETSTDVNNSMLPGLIGPAPNIRYTVDPYQTRLFGTHWCGDGGGGVPINAPDAACKAHDQCFDAAGISAASNAGGGSMTLQQAAAAQGCNAALAAAAAAHPEIPGSTRVSQWLKHGDQLLPTLGIDGHLAAGTAIR